MNAGIADHVWPIEDIVALWGGSMTKKQGPTRLLLGVGAVSLFILGRWLNSRPTEWAAESMLGVTLIYGWLGFSNTSQPKSSDLTVVSTFPSTADAEIAKGVLDEVGIKSMIRADNAGGMYPAIGGAELLVRVEDVQQANAALHRRHHRSH
jgi:hypothetical protein